MQNIDIQNLTETVEFIRSKTDMNPYAGIILGSGLGGLVNDLDISLSLAYEDIPHFPLSTVKGHGGKLLFGNLNGKDVVMLSGRFHYYEGYSMQEATFPVRVMHQLGAQLLMVSNAAGGMHPEFNVGDLMAINDHINLFPEHPLRGANDEKYGPRFPDMTEPYQLSLVKKAKEIAKKNNIKLYTLLGNKGSSGKVGEEITTKDLNCFAAFKLFFSRETTVDLYNCSASLAFISSF